MKKIYYKYPESEYIVMENGEVARLLKPTAINNQIYFNLILDGKMKRVNKNILMKPFADSENIENNGENN